MSCDVLFMVAASKAVAVWCQVDHDLAVGVFVRLSVSSVISTGGGGLFHPVLPISSRLYE